MLDLGKLSGAVMHFSNAVRSKFSLAMTRNPNPMLWRKYVRVISIQLVGCGNLKIVVSGLTLDPGNMSVAILLSLDQKQED